LDDRCEPTGSATRGLDSAELREELHARGTKPVISNRCNNQPFPFNKRLYKLRWRIENAFNG